MNIAAQSFSPRTDDAKGVGTGLLGYARAAPVDAHLGWLPEQLEAAAQDAGSSLKDSRPLKQRYWLQPNTATRYPNAA